MALVPVLQVVALALVVFVMPEYVSGADDHLDRRGFTLLGLVMLTAIAGFATVVEGGSSSLVGAALVVVALVLALVFLRVEKHTDHPAIEVDVLFAPSLGPLYLAAVASGSSRPPSR